MSTSDLEADSVEDMLSEMAEQINKPIYFVLGNHDYYEGRVNQVRKTMTTLSSNDARIHWLPESGPQKLKKGTIVVGQDGWADGRLGNYKKSRLALNDSYLISDLSQAKKKGKSKLLEKMQQLGDRDAKDLEKHLLEAVKQKPSNIIVLTHVPPFKEVCLPRGEGGLDEHLPFYASKATGDVLDRVSEANKSIKFLVLCGHTHKAATYKRSSNLTIKSGKSQYCSPLVQRLINLS